MFDDASAFVAPSLPTTTTPILYWTGLHGSAETLALANAIQSHPSLLMIVTHDNHSVQRLVQELPFFLPPKYSVLPFPDWEILPYDVFSPLPEIISQRLHTLALLPQTTQGALILSVTTLMQRLAPREHVLAHSFQWTIGDRLDLTLQRIQLETVGYQCVSQVYQHAEFAIRGSVIDLFPMGSEMPYRIELFDDEIESIRTFDPETQLSLLKIQQIQLLPAREFPLTDQSIKLFRQQFRAQFPTISPKNPLYADVSKGIMPNGIEYYLPLFVIQTATLFSYLPQETIIVLPENIADYAQQFIQEIELRYQQRRYDPDRPLLTAEQLFLSIIEFQQQLSLFKQIRLVNNTDSPLSPLINFQSLPLPELAFEPRLKQPATRLHQFLNSIQAKTLLVAETAGQREVLLETLKRYQLQPQLINHWQEFLIHSAKLCLVVATLEQGLYLSPISIAIIPESLLFAEKIQQRHSRKTSHKELDNLINNLNELTIGSPVVHREHGVGRYLGLQSLTISGIIGEFLTLEYANQDKLYVPVSALHLIGRYTGASAENAPLHRLGSEQWLKAKKKALEKIRDVAAELLDLQARRIANGKSANKGIEIDIEDYQLFAQAFPFAETPDQQTAIEAILADLSRDQPMDRVVCGDVGFGKTEVAMRAAFVAVNSGQQVAVLVPTTLLAQQHYQNFRDRFADWPIRIEVSSRFVSAKQQKRIAEELAEGKIDIIIGTHKLLSKELQYKQLGLVIIDEEHRFGVQQKEHFKKIRQQLDLLTLTATPIPRTLNMALSGLREISIIATPPVGRHPIKTFISEWIDAQIQEACLREIKRGGQVFFLHNDIKTMPNIFTQLTALIPEARIQIAHGQMPERELEQIMLDFYHQRFNLLICSTIIESGIDIPSANTIIIHRADLLGLAQLHQLRGRVGRSHHRAYAYLIIPPKKQLTKEAIKRLEAVEMSGDLGAGFLLSSHDLEIRGAGELLGEGQSGQIQEIGFGLYTELLERAVKALQSGETPELNWNLDQGTEIDLQAPALIPEDYLPDVHARLVLYKRIANYENAQQLRALKVEMIDRFGLLPEATQTLFDLAELKQLATPLGIKKIDIHQTGGRLLFQSQPSINVEKLIQLLQTQPHIYKLDGMEKLRFTLRFSSTEEKCAFLRQLLQNLYP
ncbi:MAG: Transcription-repair-coupling factor [Pseudomonadota bacterium]|jgi:transcription-repair coupling factor (superfamily II helicase)